MFELTPSQYDLLYAHKDYEREAHRLRDLLWRLDPSLHTVLDVACGTGSHDEHLCRYYEVDGLDLNAAFLQRARQRNPGGRYHETDMCAFRLDRLYDAVVCLFSAIGYAQTYERLVATLRCCREHLTGRGVALVEPWIEPERWRNDTVEDLRNERDGVHIVRLSHGGRRGGVSVLDFHYLVGSPGDGIIHRRERHEMGLFTRRHMCQAFTDAGFAAVEYDAQGLMGRGLYTARVQVAP